MFKYIFLLCVTFSASLAIPTYEDYTTDPDEDYTPEIVEHLNSLSANLESLNSESLEFEILNSTLQEMDIIVTSMLASTDDTEGFACVLYNYEVIGSDKMAYVVNTINDLLLLIYARQKLLTACENPISIIQTSCVYGVMASTQLGMTTAVYRVENAVDSIDEADLEELSICLRRLTLVLISACNWQTSCWPKYHNTNDRTRLTLMGDC